MIQRQARGVYFWVKDEISSGTYTLFISLGLNKYNNLTVECISYRRDK